MSIFLMGSGEWEMEAGDWGLGNGESRSGESGMGSREWGLGNGDSGIENREPLADSR